MTKCRDECSKLHFEFMARTNKQTCTKRETDTIRALNCFWGLFLLLWFGFVLETAGSRECLLLFLNVQLCALFLLSRLCLLTNHIDGIHWICNKTIHFFHFISTIYLSVSLLCGYNKKQNKNSEEFASKRLRFRNQEMTKSTFILSRKFNGCSTKQLVSFYYYVSPE